MNRINKYRSNNKQLFLLQKSNSRSIVSHRPKSSTGNRTTNSKRCKVLFSYQPAHEDELELKVEDVVEFLGEVEDGWWRGAVNGRSGVFPSNFVEMVSNTDAANAKEKASRVETKNKRNENMKGEESDHGHDHDSMRETV